MAFPLDDYTPHGYLDIPGHTRRLSPRGVLRSAGAGFMWHYPAYAGAYGGRRETYRAGVRLALDGALELSDFEQAASPYHSKNLVSFLLRRGPAQARVSYHRVGEHVLRGELELQGARRAALLFEYTRLIAAGGEWGESGLVGRADAGALLLQGFEDGEAFVLWASQPASDLGITADAAEAQSWLASAAPGLPAEGFVTSLGQPGQHCTLYGVAGFTAPAGERLELLLARGATRAQAEQHLAQARRDATAEQARLLAEDAAFWATAPQLEGDWPQHWRRGLVYDLETLRMMVKPPLGIYRHPWDAMQIQAPRVVLGEAAFDALLLSYADPALAQALLLGTFADAPAPNVPCSREDGSYNMVAADGTLCGTAPEWGYPWLVLDWLATLQPDRGWLERIYPHLTAYLDWWLAHRRDAGGWLVYACSWESGQDGSPRFGDQPLGGGHPTRHVRPVDLAAAFAHAAGVMAGFAGGLGYQQDQVKWQTLAEEFRQHTSQLWNGSRYADFDTRAGQPSAVEDVMLLAPLALGLAEPARAAALRQTILDIDAESLTWPMFVWTAVEAAMAAGLPEQAAALAAAVVDRAYGFWDARLAQPDRTLPGVTCEYWPPHGRCGGEGYGWGAFGLHLVLHTLVGFAPDPGGMLLRPNLPLDWRQAGRRYTLRLQLHGRPLTITLAPLDRQRVRVSVDGQSRETEWGAPLRYPWEA